MAEFLSNLNGFFWRLILSLLLFVAVVVPGTSLTVFDGLPLAPAETLLVFIGVVAIWFAPWWKRKRLRLVWAVVLVVLIFWQLVGALFLPHGWSVCLRREVEKESLSTACEASAQFRDGRRSFVVNKVDWEAGSFPIYFVNESEFHYTSEEDPDRSRLPYGLEARAFFKPKQDDVELSVVTNTQDTEVVFNGEIQPVLFDEETVIKLPADKVSEVIARFTAPHGKSNSLLVRTEAEPWYRISGDSLPGSFFAGFYVLVNILLLLIMGALVVFEWCFLAVKLSRSAKISIWFSLLVMVAVWLHGVVPDTVMALFIIGLTFWNVSNKQGRKLVPFMLLALFVVSFLYMSAVQPYDSLKILEGGDDSLTHESHARMLMKADDFGEVLSAGSEGNVFYYQPFFRYWLALIHIFMGEAMWAPFMVHTFLLGVAIWIGGLVIYRSGGSFGFGLYGLGVYVVLVLFEKTPLKLMVTNYQESLGVPLFMITVAVTVLFWYERRGFWGRHLLVGLLWGLLISTRNNLAPAGLALIVYWLGMMMLGTDMRHRLRLSLSLVLGLTVFPILVVGRNLIEAGKWAFFTESLHPNLIKPLRELFPEMAGRSELKFFSAVRHIFAEYKGGWGELRQILWDNTTGHYVGDEGLMVLGWIVFVGSVMLVMFLGKRGMPMTALMIGSALVMPMVFGSFFVHREIAVYSQTRLMLAFGLALSVVMLFRVAEERFGLMSYMAKSERSMITKAEE